MVKGNFCNANPLCQVQKLQSLSTSNPGYTVLFHLFFSITIIQLYSSNIQNTAFPLL